ncbi:MAG: HypC/HybG/HupF family hydrogenase formation chaperone [Clostridia bacterium]|nr:HypC/HybG/HupF family hydrogenase formation chaperone [Clostridia bacterium]
MCLAVPLKLISVDGRQGVGEFDGVRRSVRLDFVPKAAVGDYVIVHAGFAIETMKPEQAEADRQAFREVTDAL